MLKYGQYQIKYKKKTPAIYEGEGLQNKQIINMGKIINKNPMKRKVVVNQYNGNTVVLSNTLRILYVSSILLFQYYNEIVVLYPASTSIACRLA